MRSFSRLITIFFISSVFFTSCSWFTQPIPPATGEQVIEKSLTYFSNVKTYHFNAQPELKITGQEMDTRISLTLEGETDQTNPTNKLSQTEATLKIQDQVKEQTFNSTLSFKTLADKYYFLVKKLTMEGAENFDLTTDLIRDYLNLWYEIDPTSELGNSLEAVGGSNELKNILDQQKQQAIYEAFVKANLFKVVKEEPAQLNGLEMRHFTVSLVNEKVVDLVDQIAQIYEMSAGFDDDSKEELNALLADTNFAGEFFVGATDGLLYRVEINLVMKNPANETGTFHLLIDFSKYNQPFKIEAPTESAMFTEVLKELMLKLTPPVKVEDQAGVKIEDAKLNELSSDSATIKINDAMGKDKNI